MKLKKASIFTKLVIVGMALYAVISLVGIREQLAAAEEQKILMQEQVDAAAAINAELEYNIDHAGDPGKIEEIAREKLGLVMPGEKIFYDVSD